MHRNAFCFFTFSKWWKYCNLLDDDTLKTYCCASCHVNLKQAVFKLQAIEYPILFFLFLIYVCCNENFVKNFMKKLSIFNTNFQNSCQDVVDYRILGLFWALTSFHFNVFKNRFHMLSQCLLPSITKKIVSYYWLVLGQQSFIVFQIHIFC